MHKIVWFTIILTLSCTVTIKSNKQNWDNIAIKESDLTKLLNNRNCNESNLKYFACYRTISRLTGHLQKQITLVPIDNWNKNIKPHKDYFILVPGHKFIPYNKDIDDFIFESLKEEKSYFYYLKRKVLEAKKKTPLNFQYLYQELIKKLEQEKFFNKFSKNYIYAQLVSRYLSNVYGEYTYITRNDSDLIHAKSTLAPTYGFYFREINKRFYIDELRENGPAAKAGIRFGDEIIGIKDWYMDKFLTGPRLNSSTISVASRDEVGKSMTLKIKRKKKTLYFPITLEHMPYEEMEAKIINSPKGKIRYIRIKRFLNKSVCRKVEQLIEDKEIKSIILDLRSNGGGITKFARCITGLFLKDDSLIFSTEYFTFGIHAPEEIARKERFKVSNSSHSKIPMVILVNGNSASASEIIASTFKHHRRAFILGDKTFGKGIGQTCSKYVFDNIDDIEKIDKMIYCQTKRIIKKPNGEYLHYTGVTPDYYVRSHPDIPLRNYDDFFKLRDTPLGRLIDRNRKTNVVNYPTVARCLDKSKKTILKRYSKLQRIRVGRLKGPDLQKMYGIQAATCMI